MSISRYKVAESASPRSREMSFAEATRSSIPGGPQRVALRPTAVVRCRRDRTEGRFTNGHLLSLVSGRYGARRPREDGDARGKGR
jgi:hypothetical protein